MEIGIDDIDFVDEDFNSTGTDGTITTGNTEVHTDDGVDEEPPTVEDDSSNLKDDSEDFISYLLKTRGVEDRSKLKFENEDGETEEVDWDTLDNETKLNILNSTNKDTNVDLDENETQLINTIRQSQLTPEEYIQYVQLDSINRYLYDNQMNGYSFKVDELDDDELFVADFMTRTGVTEEEAYEALDRAKANETLFKKQIGAIRSEYLKSEEEAIKYNELRQQQEAQAKFDQFANTISNEISNLTEFAGYDLNMNEEDTQELYDFITGFDPAGNSYLGKALNDPSTLVKMSLFALYGEQMIQDINNYYKKEIANVRKNSYNEGLLAAKDKPNVIHKNIQNSNKPKSPTFDDLDDF